MAITRRQFLTRVGQAGGYSAAFLTMQAMGITPLRAENTLPLAVAPSTGKGVKVVILGGGISGLVAAYEMKALGYDCTLLEARERPGGRNWSVRGGDKIVFTDGTAQTCTFDPGHYQNVGPARLPSIHNTMLGYCRKLGVPLEVEINTSRSSFLQNDAANGGKPVVQRQVVNDTRGHVSELLAKCIAKGALDQELTAQDRDRMLSFLRLYGSLDEAGKYSGSHDAGYVKKPAQETRPAISASPSTCTPSSTKTSGMASSLKKPSRCRPPCSSPSAAWTEFPTPSPKPSAKPSNSAPRSPRFARPPTASASATRRPASQRQLRPITASAACRSILLKKIPNDFSAPFKKIIAECTYAGAYKIAWESRRFWEQDYNIYGGLEFLNTGCSPVWLPSAGLFSPRGVLVSGYGFDSPPEFDRLTLEEKFAASRHSIERLHPGHGHELEKPIYVGWHRVPYNEGSWIASLRSKRGLLSRPPRPGIRNSHRARRPHLFCRRPRKPHSRLAGGRGPQCFARRTDDQRPRQPARA